MCNQACSKERCVYQCVISVHDKKRDAHACLKHRDDFYSLQSELEEMERTVPSVRKAAANYDRVVQSILLKDRGETPRRTYDPLDLDELE